MYEVKIMNETHSLIVSSITIRNKQNGEFSRKTNYGEITVLKKVEIK